MRSRHETDLILGVDTGTSGVKTALFTLTGRPVAVARRPLPLNRPENGWVELSASDIWHAVVSATQEVVAAAGSADRVIAIGLSTTCPAVVFMDREGDALRPVITFLDARAGAELEQLRAAYGSSGFFARTGNRLAQSTCSLATMLWVQRHQREVWENTFVTGHLNTFVGYKLTGEFGIDPTNAAYTGLYDVRANNLRWDEAASGFSVTEKLPPIVPSARTVGRLRSTAARALGLPSGIPVAMGAADTACSALAVGVVEGGDVFETTGTSAVVTVCSTTPRLDDRFMNRPHVVPGRWLLHGAMSGAGAALSWATSTLLEAGEGIRFEEVEALVALARPGAGGVLFLPYIQGERTPVWDSNARGVFVGLSLGTSRADLLRSVMEGAAFGLRQIIEIVETDLETSMPSLLSVGGASRSRVWTQIKADVTGKVFRRLRMPETAALGAALLGGLAAGVYRDAREAVSHLPLADVEIFQPRQAHVPIYDGLYQVYRRLYPALREEFQQLASVRLSRGG